MRVLLSSTVPLSLRCFYADMLDRLRAAGHDVAVVSSPGAELDAIGRGHDVRVHAVAMARRISPLADLRALFRLWRVMRRERPDVVHSMTPKAGLLVMAAAGMAGVRVRIHTFTGLVFPTSRGLRRMLLKATDRLTCACATHIIPEGEGVRADLLRHGITKKPLQIIGHGNLRGIDLTHYSRTPDVMARARRIRESADGDFVFVFVGRIVADKGMRELVAAFCRLHARMPRARLLLVGSPEADIDPLDEDTRRAADTCRAILAVGAQNDVRPWMAAADALVFPSYREGFPNVVLEAGAMGLPSIVTDINGSREIITDGANGLVVPTHDADALFRAMLRMADDDDGRRRMAEAARPAVAARWEQENLRRLQLQFYYDAAGLSHI